MLAIERKNEILDKLRAEQRVLVSDLAAYYHVTEETIRRDLDKLEKEGYATKTYGGAILGNSTKTDLSYTIRNKTNVAFLLGNLPVVGAGVIWLLTQTWRDRCHPWLQRCR